MLGRRTLRQDQIVQLGNYSYSSIRVTSIDEGKKQPMKDYSGSKLNCVQTTSLFTCINKGHVLLRLELRLQCFKNQLQSSNLSQNCLDAKALTFNIRTLNTVNQLPELTASTAKHNVDIICILEQR